MKVQSPIVVIYDGQCRFCQASVAWISQRLSIDAKAFQEVDLSQFGLTIEQASKSVQVIAQGQTLAGAAAISYLLKQRGNKVLSFVITATGPLGRLGYNWVATHRNSQLVAIATKILERSK
jgi:predicted DCC family thiol-disulfide oxidoreductase YuxK